MAISGRIRERIYLPARLWASINEIGLGIGTPIISQVTGKQDIGFEMAAVGNVVTISIATPFFLDPQQDIGMRINWTTGSLTAADTVDWIILFEFIDEDVQIPNLIGKTLDTPIAQDTVGAATGFLNKWTNRGVIDHLTNPNLPTRANLENGTRLMLSVEMDAAAAGLDLGTEKVWFLGLELDFVRRDFIGTTGLNEALSAIPA